MSKNVSELSSIGVSSAKHASFVNFGTLNGELLERLALLLNHYFPMEHSGSDAKISTLKLAS